jgi:hypothetical protein
MRVSSFCRLKLAQEIVRSILGISAVERLQSAVFGLFFVELQINEAGFEVLRMPGVGLAVVVELCEYFSFLRGHVAFEEVAFAFG